MRFKKAVLKVGQYKSPDGVVDVTPDRLKHWAAEFSRMQNAKQVIPIDWDHASSEDQLKPLTMDAYEKRRSAKNTVGRLSEFKVGKDGQSAEIVLDIPDVHAATKAETNLVYVSPVIFPSWKDGAGNEYQDCLTHCDLVNHPVDHSQGPFAPVEPGVIACAIRMGLSGVYRMADDDADGIPDDVEDGDKEPDEVDDQSGRLKSVVEALAQMDIVLSEDTNTENLLAHLHQALLTAAAHRGEDDPNSPRDGGDTVTVADPGASGATALSLEARGAIAWAEKTHREQVAGRLRKVLDEGRCTGAEFKTRNPETASIKLSLDAKGQPALSDLEKWLDSREAVPKGTFWEPGERAKRMATTVEEPPASMRGDMTDEEARKTVDWALGRKPAAK